MYDGIFEIRCSFKMFSCNVQLSLKISGSKQFLHTCSDTCGSITELRNGSLSFVNIYIFIAIAQDESIFLGVLHFPMKNIKSCDLKATPMGGATSNPASDVVCLLLFV